MRKSISSLLLAVVFVAIGCAAQPRVAAVISHTPLRLAAAAASNAIAGNGEDCTVYCATQFGAGVGVTCQAWLDTAGRCRPFCYYENGWWFDESTGAAIRRPDGTTNDQRPDQGQV